MKIVFENNVIRIKHNGNLTSPMVWMENKETGETASLFLGGSHNGATFWLSSNGTPPRISVLQNIHHRVEEYFDPSVKK